MFKLEFMSVIGRSNLFHLKKKIASRMWIRHAKNNETRLAIIEKVCNIEEALCN